MLLGYYVVMLLCYCNIMLLGHYVVVLLRYCNVMLLRCQGITLLQYYNIPLCECITHCVSISPPQWPSPIFPSLKYREQTEGCWRGVGWAEGLNG